MNSEYLTISKNQKWRTQGTSELLTYPHLLPLPPTPPTTLLSNLTLSPELHPSEECFTCMRAASRLRILRRKRRGISLRKMGMKSPRPSFTARLAFPPINNELLRNIPEIQVNSVQNKVHWLPRLRYLSLYWVYFRYLPPDFYLPRICLTSQ